MHRIVKTLLTIALWLALSVTAWAAGIPIPVYLDSGQSNGSCPALLTDVDPRTTDLQAAASVFIFNKTHPDGELLEPGVNNCERLTGRFGPELGLAARLGADYEYAAIIKLAVGGTGVYPLDGFDDWNPESRELALDFVNLIRHALDTLIAAGYEPYIQRWLIVNGEADSRTVHRASAYKPNMKYLIAYVREEINQLSIPVSMVRLTRIDLVPDKVFPFASMVRQAQEEIALEDPTITLIDADGWPKDDTLIHYAAPGTLSMGDQTYKAAPYTDRYRYVGGNGLQ